MWGATRVGLHQASSLRLAQSAPGLPFCRLFLLWQLSAQGHLRAGTHRVCRERQK